MRSMGMDGMSVGGFLLNEKRYRLRRGVTYEEHGGKSFLISAFPLKFLLLPEMTTPLFRFLQGNPDGALDELGVACGKQQRQHSAHRKAAHKDGIAVLAHAV